MDTPRQTIGGPPPGSRAPNYFECFPDEKLLPTITLDYLRGSRAAYNVCVKLTRALKVPWMILVTSMAYFHRFFFDKNRQQQKKISSSANINNKVNNNSTSSSNAYNNNNDESNNNGSRSRSETPSTFRPSNTTTSNNNSSSSSLLLLNSSKSEQNLAGLVFENDEINVEDEDEILAEEKTFEKYHPVLVAVAAFFLALKTECVHRPLKTIVTHAFEISASNEQYPIRREQVIRIELMLMHSINFHLFQELPWTRAMELLPPVMSNTNHDSSSTSGGDNNHSNNTGNNQNEMNKAMLSLFQKVLGYLVQFPFQSCYSASAIAECAVWFVADSLETPDKQDLEKKLVATTQNIRQRFSNHIIDHIAFFDRPEGREVPKLAAKITALKTRMRMQYGGTGSGSGIGSGSVGTAAFNNNSSRAHNSNSNNSRNSSNHYHANSNHHRNSSSSSILMGNNNGTNNNNSSSHHQISPVPTGGAVLNANNNNNNNNNNTNRIRERDEQQAIPNHHQQQQQQRTSMHQPLSVRRPPPSSN